MAVNAQVVCFLDSSVVGGKFPARNGESFKKYAQAYIKEVNPDINFDNWVFIPSNVTSVQALPSQQPTPVFLSEKTDPQLATTTISQSTYNPNGDIY